MDKNRLIELLESIGIKGYEAKAYLALIEVGEASAPEIASRAGIPQPRVYEILDTLLRKGLVEVKIGRPRTYKALPPNVALELYIKKYVDDIYGRAARLLEELTRLYSLGGVREREPLIWINYSIDSGLEKARRILMDMRYDGFLSADKVMLDKLYIPIAEKLSKNTKSIIGLVAIGSDVEEYVTKRFSALNRLELRLLPTGIVRMVEVDLADVMVVGENYTMHSREWELILIVNEVFYFGYWRLAKPVKEVEVKPGEEYTLTHQWLAMDIASRALKQNLNIKARIKGYETRTHRPIVVEGYVKEVIRVPEDHIRTIVIEKSSGEKIRIGGLGATLEDVEARMIEFKIE